MGQKIHPTIYRVGRKICWDSLWSTYEENYGTKTFFNIRRNTFFRKKLYLWGFFPNSASIINTNKNTRIVSRNFQASIFSDNLKTNKISSFIYFTKTTIIDILFLPNRLNIKKAFFYRGLKIIQAQLLTEYIASQITKSYKAKDPFFKKSLLFGILKTILVLINFVVNSKTHMISGVKIECSGRWKQTSTGRTQKIRFMIGKISNQQTNKFISFGHSTSHTKYGSFGVKIWICYNDF